MIDNSKSKTSFTGGSIKIIPDGKGKIILEKFRDEYRYNKCSLGMNNLLIGKVYIENCGEVVIECKKYQTKAIINFKEQSFWNKNQYNVVEGVIERAGQECYLLKGKWDEILHMTDPRTKAVKVLWKKTHESNKDYYYFNDYTFQMNHLNKALFQQLLVKNISITILKNVSILCFIFV